VNLNTDFVALSQPESQALVDVLKLLETRLDPRQGKYPTFRNIAERVRKQRVSIEQFLKLILAKRAEVFVALAAARSQAESAPLALDPKYIAALGHARVPISLRRILDGQLETVNFVDHRTVAVDSPLPLPRAYLVHDDHADLARLFDRHGIDYRILRDAQTEWVVEFASDSAKLPNKEPIDRITERHISLRALPGDLWVSVDQPRGRLAALILEPRSTSSLFRTPQYVQFCKPGESLPVYRIPRY
jgi:hypothetical protein